MTASKPSFSEISKTLQETDLTGLPPLRLGILRNIMLEPLATYLRYEALGLGHNAEVRLGEYDNVFQESVGGEQNAYDERTDAVLIFLHLEGISWKLARDFNVLSQDEIRQEIERIREHCAAIVQGLRERTPAMILWHGFLPPLHPALGLFDSQTEQGQIQTVQTLNNAVRSTVRDVPNAYFVDLGLSLARVGGRRFLDNRYWHMGRAPYTLEAYEDIACEAAKFLRARLGKARKCLVLDCDNTLWGGIIGEDGLAGIKLGESSPGSAYVEFQQQILDLNNRGVILALCSKNNEEDVWEVLEKHPASVIRRRHIAASRINWNDKAANIRELAVELNIGLDSMVFVDDSDFEVNLVRRELPEVEVLHLPKDKPFNAREMLVEHGWFDTLTVSREDRARGGMYAAEAERKQLLSAATDLKSYYRSLEMRLSLSFADSFSIPRVAQQTQKTNQFNLTTRRYSEADISTFVSSPDADVICIQLSDKFGDSGIVGSCVLRYDGDQAVFDTFLLSCRALGRGVEEVFLNYALQLAQKRHAAVAVGEYIPTRKNAQVEDFYAKQGFTEPSSELAQGLRRFTLLLDRPLKAIPDYYCEITSKLDI
jgi:FkbH-like protein